MPCSIGIEPKSVLRLKAAFFRGLLVAGDHEGRLENFDLLEARAYLSGTHQHGGTKLAGGSRRFLKSVGEWIAKLSGSLDNF